MNLGVVLLPLRVFLGFISVYAGMGKLCDPVYFDGGERGSMVTWLRSLDPWAIASPLHDSRWRTRSAPAHRRLPPGHRRRPDGLRTVAARRRLPRRAPVGRPAMTVSWSTVPAYDAPDIIYLAAWSPLIIAGAPVYSIDGRLAGDAWRRLGPRVEIWDLRRRVLRRGAVVATVVVGLALLVGSLLGSAARPPDRLTVRENEEVPANQLPGSPLPRRAAQAPRTGPPPGPGWPAPDASGSPTRRASSSGSPSSRRRERVPPTSVQRPGAQVRRPAARGTAPPPSPPHRGRGSGRQRPDAQPAAAPQHPLGGTSRQTPASTWAREPQQQRRLGGSSGGSSSSSRRGRGQAGSAACWG